MPPANSITTLSELIAQAESSNNQFAARFEPAYHPNPENVKKLAVDIGCTYSTAEILCSISWGLFQIMGNNLVEMGLSISPIQYCSSIPIQQMYFQKYITENHCAYTLDDILNDSAKRLDFAEKYNGPGMPHQYADYLIASYKKGAL